MVSSLKEAYPWIAEPLIVSAPMLGAATTSLALSVVEAGGIGFLAGGVNPAGLEEQFEKFKSSLANAPKSMTGDTLGQLGYLPVGVGFQLFNCPLEPIAEVIGKHRPAIVWLFAPKATEDLKLWAARCREVTQGRTKIWVQVGSVQEAKLAVSLAEPDVLVLQGCDAGGHGQVRSASIISLVPEVADALATVGRSGLPILAAGGIVDGRGVAAALALGASGAVLGTRFLAAEEAGIAAGWKKEVLRCDDGGRSTVRSTLCDRLKETKGWPAIYDGRAIENKGHDDEKEGLSDEQNVQLYKQELKSGDDAWGLHGRMVAYAGTGVGLVRSIEAASTIVTQVVEQAKRIIHRG